MARVPEMRRFPTVDEMGAELARLAARHPELVRVRVIGSSRRGEPIRMASVGTSRRHALVFGGPHPDEPVGFLTVRKLGRVLCTDDQLREELGYTWHLIPCVDPDGARLNEGWYGQPHDRERHGRARYRPAIAEQVEWTFPHPDTPDRREGVLPETAALAHVIDELAPALQCSLHNGDYGGVFHYLSVADDRLARRLADVPAWAGLPLHSAVWEIPANSIITPGVILAPTTAQVTAMGAPATGVSSVDHARRHGTVTVVSEVPYWEDPRAADTTPCGHPLGEIIGASRRTWNGAARGLRRVLATVDRDLRLDTAFRRSAVDGLRIGDGLAAGWTALADAPDVARRSATVAEQCSFEALPHMLRLRLSRVPPARAGSAPTWFMR
jgi:hypothetical protein